MGCVKSHTDRSVLGGIRRKPIATFVFGVGFQRHIAAHSDPLNAVAAMIAPHGKKHEAEGLDSHGAQKAAPREDGKKSFE